MPEWLGGWCVSRIEEQGALRWAGGSRAQRRCPASGALAGGPSVVRRSSFAARLGGCCMLLGLLWLQQQQAAATAALAATNIGDAGVPRSRYVCRTLSLHGSIALICGHRSGTHIPWLYLITEEQTTDADHDLAMIIAVRRR